MALAPQQSPGTDAAPDVVAYRTKGEAVAALQAWEEGRAVPTGHEADGRSAKAKPDRKGILVGALFMAAVFGSLLIYIRTTGEGPALVGALGRVEAPWVWATFAVMVAYLAFGTLAFVTTVAVTPDAPAGVLDLCSVEAAGTLFGNLTPMMAGSVPGQIWRLVKSGLGFGAALSLIHI